MKQKIPSELIKKGNIFTLDELSYVQYVKKSPYWHTDVQFLTRPRPIDLTSLRKSNRDTTWDIFKSGVPYNYTEMQIKEVSKLSDAHVGMKSSMINHKAHMGTWQILRKLMEVVIPEEDTDSWNFVDEYWNAFKTVATDEKFQK